MKRLVKKLFRIFVYTGFITILVVMIYVGTILKDIPFSLLESYLGQIKSYKTVSNSDIEIEKESLVNLVQLKTFYNFSAENKKFSKWFKIKNNNELEFMTSSSSKMLLNKNIILKNLLKNFCSEIYCYQHQLAFDNIPSVFWKGLIGIEDYRFLTHIGVDFKSIARAIIKDIYEMKLAQGASTLTQQLVRNLVFTSEKTFSRKFKEIILSVYLEIRFSKEKILETYFNEVYWGALQGIKIKGIYSASLFYFGKRPREIKPFEAAILISLLKGPGYYSPTRHIKRLRSRTEIVFNKLIQLKLFSKSENRRWTDRDWKKWHNKILKNNEDRPYFNVWETLKNKSEYISNYEKFIFNWSARSVLKNIKKKVGKDKDIAIKAFIGRPNIQSDEQKTFLYYSKTERDKELAISEEGHQIGSTIKPIAYEIFLKHGQKFDQLVETKEITLNLKSGKWSPREAHVPESSEITTREALLKSFNRPVIRIANEIGLDVIENDMVEYVEDLKLPLSEYPAQLLGSIELSLKDMHMMYSRLVINQCRNFIVDNRINQNNILSVLSDPKLSTTRRVISKDLKEMRFFGKTGTSNNGNDNWYIFFDGQNLGIIWVGLEGKKSKDDLRLYGGSTAFRVFQQFFINRGKRFNELQCFDFMEP